MATELKGLGFFHMELPEPEEEEPSLIASVTVLSKGSSSPEQIAAELTHLCTTDADWDWQVETISDKKFSVMFPDPFIFGYCIVSTLQMAKAQARRGKREAAKAKA